MELRKVTKSHWGKICSDPASYGIGNIYRERYEHAHESCERKVNSWLKKLYLLNILKTERLKNEESKRGFAEGPVGLARAYQASGAAYQQVYSGINKPVRQAPIPTSQIVPNPYYGIGGNYSAVAFRQPSGLITT